VGGVEPDIGPRAAQISGEPFRKGGIVSGMADEDPVVSPW